ncbi:cytochrome P450 [Streptomyces sp. NPDC056716]|uniref:cytochrome P450 n=1 Tax=unclassified Streptomyces TaxID=2593676 RepID=UPI0036CA45EB
MRTTPAHDTTTRIPTPTPGHARAPAPFADGTLSLLRKGYGWLPDLRRRAAEAEAVPVRVLGRRGVALHGRRAVEFFYDERNLRRTDALPGPVLDTLFGRGAVHTLDGEPHRERKALFMVLLTDPDRIGALVERVGEEWERAEAEWPGREPVVLFDETARILTRAVYGWAGVPLPPDAVADNARDLVAMVDGFATPGPRRTRARRARQRQERRLAALIEELRSAGAPSGQATLAQAMAAYCDAGSGQPDPRTVAVELLNVLRPVVAVAWFLTFAAHALHRWPQHRAPLAGETHGGIADATADATAEDPDHNMDDYARAFAQEIRRFYPFVPFLGGLAARDTQWQDTPLREGDLVLLDVYGLHHDPVWWPEPYAFDPDRFAPGGSARPDVLIPQGGGDPATGHRCPGEDITLALLTALLPRLARLRHTLPAQDLSIPLRRMPTRPRDGYVMTGMHRRVALSEQHHRGG